MGNRGFLGALIVISTVLTIGTLTQAKQNKTLLDYFFLNVSTFGITMLGAYWGALISQRMSNEKVEKSQHSRLPEEQKNNGRHKKNSKK